LNILLLLAVVGVELGMVAVVVPEDLEQMYLVIHYPPDLHFQ
jgi:hypothetical protein